MYRAQHIFSLSFKKVNLFYYWISIFPPDSSVFIIKPLVYLPRCTDKLHTYWECNHHNEPILKITHQCMMKLLGVISMVICFGIIYHSQPEYSDLSKQCSSRSEAAECGIWSVSTLFATQSSSFCTDQQVLKWNCSNFWDCQIFWQVSKYQNSNQPEHLCSWSVLLSTWRNFASFTIQNMLSEASDQTELMRRLIWFLLGTYVWRHVFWCCGLYCVWTFNPSHAE